MQNVKLKDDPIWDFLADSIRIGRSQAIVISQAHPNSAAEIQRSNENDITDRLTRMLILNPRRTKTWLLQQDPLIKRCGVFAADRAARVAISMTKVHHVLTTRLPIKRLSSTRH